MKSTFRGVVRLLLVGLLFLSAFLDFVFRIRLWGRASLSARAAWMTFWARIFLRILNGKVTRAGRPPTCGLLVSNHLGYVDILVYGSIFPLILLSKSEVRDWPVIGGLTRIAGTLYIRRESKSDVVTLGDDMAKVVDAGMVLAVFLEGTSSGGDVVLPFRSSLLAPAEQHRWPVTASWIHYHLPGGSAADEVCYWRDMTFFPHLFNLLCQPGFEAFVVFDEPLTAPLDRKEMARELHARVCRMKENFETAEQQDSASRA